MWNIITNSKSDNKIRIHQGNLKIYMSLKLYVQVWLHQLFMDEYSISSQGRNFEFALGATTPNKIFRTIFLI